ncbi:MAG: hypothetical protein U5L09_08465 [Bacteroidales bacterium]|nr:hypothetical protein [Bacteroidales bacterium]
MKKEQTGTSFPDFTLSEGTLATGSVIVIGTSDLQATTEGNGAVFHEKGFTFNGDDALVVKYGGTTTDVFGEPGVDPGSAWNGNGVSTANQNIALLEGITDGDLDGWDDPSIRFETISTDPVNNQSGFGIAPGSAASPFITVSETTLSGFSYFEGDGPSAEQTFTVEGTDLTDDISIAAPADFEISETSGSGFGSTITLTKNGGIVDETTIHVRLSAGLSIGDYTGDIELTSTDATTQTVSLSGSVNDASANIEDFTNSNATGSYSSDPLLEITE